MRSPRDTRPRALALPLRVNSSTGRALKAGPFAVALPEVYDACVNVHFPGTSPGRRCLIRMLATAGRLQP
ncbi:hypothetical protein KC324_g17 [Hortaea werneckii]|nr:hypothetical protein KC324_g17 [Hortaea werneckii]